MARDILITRRDWTQQTGVLFSGGLWDLSLANLLDYRPQFVTQAHNNIPTSTTFDVDLLIQRKIGLFFFANLRTTTLGIIRIRAGMTSDFSTTVYDVQTSSWPQDSGQLVNTVWDEFTVNGVYYSEEYIALGMTRFFIPTVPINARYIRVEIIDSTASAPLQIGCFGACEVWEPVYKFSDYAPGFEDESSMMRVPGGSTYINNIRPVKRRFIDFGFRSLPEDEFLLKSFGHGLLKGNHQPLVVVPKPEEVSSLEKLSIYGMFSQAPRFNNRYFGLYEHVYRIEQLV